MVRHRPQVGTPGSCSFETSNPSPSVHVLNRTALAGSSTTPEINPLGIPAIQSASSSSSPTRTASSTSNDTSEVSPNLVPFGTIVPVTSENGSCGDCGFELEPSLIKYSRVVEFTTSSVTATIVPYVTPLGNGTFVTHNSTFVNYQANATSHSDFIAPNSTLLTWEAYGTTL
jgi:hypothetical protein